jgi:hypothetical protein
MPKKIKVNIYDDMRQSLTDALAYERGQKVDLRVTEPPACRSYSNQMKSDASERASTQARPHSHTSSASAQRPCRVGSRDRDVLSARHCGFLPLRRKIQPLSSRANSTKSKSDEENRSRLRLASVDDPSKIGHSRTAIRHRLSMEMCPSQARWC